MSAALCLEPSMSTQGPFEDLIAMLDDALLASKVPGVDRREAARVALELGNTHGMRGSVKESIAELETVLEDQEHLPNFQDISVDQATMTTDDRWKTYFLYGYGFKSEANCARCPHTARVCAAIPGMKTAFFSILAPGKHLPPHRGPYKGVMRYHLGLLIPEPAEQCGIRVDTETRHWTQGASMIFDDTYEHEAWNDTDKTRVVLFVDFVRPLSAPARWVNAAVLWAIAFSPFIGDAKRRHDEWEKRFEAIKERRAAAEAGH